MRFSQASQELKQSSDVLASASFLALEHGDREAATKLDNLRRRARSLSDLVRTWAIETKDSSASDAADELRQFSKRASEIRDLVQTKSEARPLDFGSLENCATRLEDNLRSSFRYALQDADFRRKPRLNGKLHQVIFGRRTEIESVLLQIANAKGTKCSYLPMFQLISQVRSTLGDSVKPIDVKKSVERLSKLGAIAGIRNVGGLDIVEISPATIDEDQLDILKLAAKSSSLTLTDCMTNLNWTQERAMRALKGIEIAGIAIFDMGKKRWIFQEVAEQRIG
jgi:hypothetical protein